MKFKFLITIFLTTLFFSSPGYSATLIGCFPSENGQGTANRADAARQEGSLATKKGNNGIGNGGESANIWVVPGDPADITVECIRTADEDTGGRVYVWLQVPEIWVDAGPSDEFDPGAFDN